MSQTNPKNFFHKRPPTAVFYWNANDTTSNSVVWGIAGYTYRDGIAIDAAYPANVTVTDANASTAYQVRVSAASGAITLRGTGLAGNDMVLFRVQRIGGDGSDSLAAVANLLGVMINYTRV